MDLAMRDKAAMKLVFDKNPDGEVEPVISVVWTISDELVEKLADETKNPHVIIAVSAARNETYGNVVAERLDVTKMYVIPLTTTIPKEYVQFARPGKNVVTAFIVDIKNKYDAGSISSARKNPSAIYEINPKFVERLNENRMTEFEAYDDEGLSRYQTSLTFEDLYVLGGVSYQVNVPAELFAPEPSKARKALVTQYFPKYAVDQCDFRKRELISLALSIPVQFAGIFIRFFSLVYGIFMAKRGMSVRNLLALNPLDFPRSLRLNKSFWHYDSKGEKRKTLLGYINPPSVLFWLFVVTIFCMIGGGLLGLVRFGLNGLRGLSPFELLLNAILGGLLLAALAGAIVVVSTYTGRRAIGSVWDYVVSLSHTRQTVEHAYDPEEARKLRLAELQLIADRSSTIYSADDVQDASINLLFKRAKQAVCKPFAR